MKPSLACIEQLHSILGTRPDLRSSLESAIQNASVPGITDLSGYFQFLTDLLTHVPTMREMNPATEKFHYVVNCSPNDLLQTDETFQQWLVAFARDHGSFLDTRESAEGLDTFINDPSFNMQDYYRGPSGWLTFNQFFARSQNQANARWPSPVTTQLSSLQLTAHTSDVGRRYHTPVRGIVKEARTIPGRAFVDEVKTNGKFTTRDDIGFQFRQTLVSSSWILPLVMSRPFPLAWGMSLL